MCLCVSSSLSHPASSTSGTRDRPRGGSADEAVPRPSPILSLIIPTSTLLASFPPPQPLLAHPPAIFSCHIAMAKETSAPSQSVAELNACVSSSSGARPVKVTSFREWMIASQIGMGNDNACQKLAVG